MQGQGDSTFGLGTLTRYELAVLLAVLDNAECANQFGLSRLTGSITYAIENGYLAGEILNDAGWNLISDNTWSAKATREEVVVAVVKQQNVDVTNVNTSILDRFDDYAQISEGGHSNTWPIRSATA